VTATFFTDTLAWWNIHNQASK